MEMTSQHVVEAYIKLFFDKPGTFIEIGCWDGELISQTAFLERELGWHGLCIDPFPRNFENRTCKLAETAVSKDGKPREFVKVTIDRRYGGDVSYFSGFKETIRAHWPTIEEFCDYEIIKVLTDTFEGLMWQYSMPKYIEFLSVDVEGAELEIFQSIDFSQFHFGMIDFEHNNNEETRKAIGEILTANGYRLHVELKLDDLYVAAGS